MNTKYKIDVEKVRKQALIDLIKDIPLEILQIAYFYAKNYAEYGEDVTKTLTTAAENAAALENAYRKGYYDGLERGREKVPDYEAKVITRGNCMLCGKELTEGIFFCKECEAKDGKG